MIYSLPYMEHEGLIVCSYALHWFLSGARLSSVHTNMFHLPSIIQLHNTQTTNKMHFNVNDVF